MKLSKIRLSESGEKIQYLLREQNDNTVRFVINYPGILNPNILCEATKTVILKEDVLHASFFADKLNAYWNVNDEIEDISFFRYVKTVGNPNVTAQSLATLPITAESDTKLCCTLVQNEYSSSIVITISHLCVDGSDGKYLVKKIIEAYNMISDSKDMQEFSVKNGSRGYSQVYDDISINEFLSLIKNPIKSATMQPIFHSKEEGIARMVQRVIPKELMDEARNYAKEVGASANDLLLTAYYHTYSQLEGVDPKSAMTIMSMIDLRRHCKHGESEGLCNLSGTFPTMLENGVGNTFKETLVEIVKQTAASKEDPLVGLAGVPLLHGATQTMPMGLLVMAASKIYGNMSLGLTNLGNISCDELAMGGIVPTDGLFGGPLKKKPGFQISAMSFDGKCSLCVFTKATDEDEILVKKILDGIVDQINQFVMDSKE